MSFSRVVVSLPVADRRTSFTFYSEGLGLDAVGETLHEDGLPEPLQFALNDGVCLMLIPTVGFGWVIGDHEVARPGQSECFFSLTAENEAGVHDVVDRAHQAGAEIVGRPELKPWGYTAAFADPDGHVWTVTGGGGGADQHEPE